jgi:hypothetical protein
MKFNFFFSLLAQISKFRIKGFFFVWDGGGEVGHEYIHHTPEEFLSATIGTCIKKEVSTRGDHASIHRKGCVHSALGMDGDGRPLVWLCGECSADGNVKRVALSKHQVAMPCSLSLRAYGLSTEHLIFFWELRTWNPWICTNYRAGICNRVSSEIIFLGSSQ